jgi:hypothetical protein
VALVVAVALAQEKEKEATKLDQRIDKLLEQNEQILKNQEEILKNQQNTLQRLDKIDEQILGIRRKTS